MSEKTVDYGVEDINEVNNESVLINMFGKEFVSGVGSVAEIAGMIHALELVGIEPQDALDYILQMKAAEHEKSILDENNRIQIEIAKIQGVQAEKNSV